MAEFREDTSAVDSPLADRLDGGVGHVVPLSKDAAEFSARSNARRILVSQATSGPGAGAVAEHVTDILSLGAPRKVSRVVAGGVMAGSVTNDRTGEGTRALMEESMDMDVITTSIHAQSPVTVAIQRERPDDALIGLCIDGGDEVSVGRCAIRTTGQGVSCG